MPLSKQILRVLGFLAVGVLVVPFSAQARAASRGDAYFGYVRTGSDIFYPNTPGLNGWDLDGEVITHRYLGVEGDIGHYGIGAGSTVPRTTSVLFGPKVSAGPGGFKFFGHFLIGGEHSANSANPGHISGGAFAYALGAGVDVPIMPILAWRVQLDRLSAPSQSPSNATNIRFTTGIAVHF